MTTSFEVSPDLEDFIRRMDGRAANALMYPPEDPPPTIAHLEGQGA